MSATKNALVPDRLDIVDMPRDTQGALGSLRGALCATFNYVKQYPAKLEFFIEVLEYVLERAKDMTNGVVEAAAKAQEEARLAELAAAETAKQELIKAEIAEKVSVIKADGKAVIEQAQTITVLEELKEYIITSGFEPEGTTVEEICTAFVKAKTAQVLAQVADYKASVTTQE